MNDDYKSQTTVVLSFLDDARRLIEAGKVRRWVVFKWTAAINILLTTALFAQTKPPITPYAFFIMSLIVSVMGGLRPGIVRDLRKQVAILEQEIAELKQVRSGRG